MIFVDTNVWMYAVGRGHPLRERARDFLEESLEQKVSLVTSAEVLQELIHAYLPVERLPTLDAAFSLAQGLSQEIFPVEPEDVFHARALTEHHPHLGARELVHLACCRRRGIRSLQTFDRGLAAVFAKSGRS